MPKIRVPGCAMKPTPSSRKGRTIAAANGSVIREYGVMELKFASKDGTQRAWDMLVTDVKKALKSIALTCDGTDTGECEVLFTKRGGKIMNLKSGEHIDFDRTGNTYGMEAWVHVGDARANGRTAGFTRPAVAP